MYRIELSPGEEAAFRSIEELAVAIRRGVVTSKARIWHNATNKWLPIQFHPHYKTAATMPLTQADLVVGAPVAPLSALSVPDPASQESRVTPFRPVLPTSQPEATAPASRVTPFKPAPHTLQPEATEPVSRVTPFKPTSPYHQAAPQANDAPTAGLPFIELGSMNAPEPARPEPVRPEPLRPLPATPMFGRPQPSTPMFGRPKPALKAAAPVEQSSRKKKPSRTRKPSKRPLRVAFIGALLIGGAHVLVSAGGALGPDPLRSHRRLIAAAPEAIKRDSPRTVAAVIPVLRNSSVPGAAVNLTPGAATPRRPGPTLGPAAVPPAADSTRADSAPEIQSAPAVEMAPAPAAADSVSVNVVDSSGKKVLKGILRAVSGAPESEKKPSNQKRKPPRR
jgi:hypothetical protein